MKTAIVKAKQTNQKSRIIGWEVHEDNLASERAAKGTELSHQKHPEATRPMLVRTAGVSCRVADPRVP